MEDGRSATSSLTSSQLAASPKQLASNLDRSFDANSTDSGSRLGDTTTRGRVFQNSDRSLGGSRPSSARSRLSTNSISSKFSSAAINTMPSSSSTPLLTLPALSSTLSLSLRGGLKKGADGTNLGPPTFYFVRIRGELHNYEVVANLLGRGETVRSLAAYLVKPLATDIHKRVVAAQSLTSPKDILRPLSDKETSDRIKAAKKEPEVRDVCHFILSDLFRSLLVPWDIGTNLIDAVNTLSSGLSISGTLSTSLRGGPVYGVFFEELRGYSLGEQFLLELQFALHNESPTAPVSKQYISYADKDKTPDYWILREDTLFADRRQHHISKESFYAALLLIGFSPKGVLYKVIDRM